MRVAVIAQQASAGGGTRFLRPLVMALARTQPDMHITLFVNTYAAEVFGAGEGFVDERINVVPVDPVISAHPGCELDGHAPVSGRRTVLEATGISDRRALMHRTVSDLARAVAGFDVVYLAWPFFLHPMLVRPPVVGTFHDFNFKHDFKTLGPQFIELLDAQIGFWLDRCEVAVTSAQFIAGELAHFYPTSANKTMVVRLSTLLAGAPEQIDCHAPERHGLPAKYVICPSNTSRHKNLERLLRAYVGVRAVGGPPLVLIGNGTQLLSGLSEAQAADPTAIRLLETFRATGLTLGHDVYALGYVSDGDADALIAGAQLLVAPSLYEAGSGPGLDAWALGTPVTMSAIPPFLEHLEFLGVSAKMFDPTDEGAMSGAIVSVLDDPDAAAEMAARSKVAIGRYTWAEVAAGYRAAFEAAMAAHRAR